MKSNVSRRTARGKAVLASGLLVSLPIAAGGLTWTLAADADTPALPAHFSGLLNDYTPAAPTVSGGPYELHGSWTLDLHGSAARFSAELTMETADFANPDPARDPTKLSPHTHHISVADGVVHNDPTDPINWTNSCPAVKPPSAGGFVVTGNAFITVNGANPPFGNPSPVTICILGNAQNPGISGSQAYVTFSNFTLTIGQPASAHFGTQAINGVITGCGTPGQHTSQDCAVTVVD